jgi:UDP-glucose 4-epimerase
MMQKCILITGGFGFLGRAVALKFKQLSYRVVGIGRGRWAPQDALAHGFDLWLDAGVSLASLMTLNDDFELVVHCAGNGSVGYSLANPLQDFYKTVQGTAELLEYLRLSNSKALLVYPSSAGVYGTKEDAPIRENDELRPISPYGYHKKIAEEMLELYSQSYGIRVAIIRFFSIYGPGLTKQLLWDACEKLLFANKEPAVFWGTGEETRDWISSEDAAELIYFVSKAKAGFTVINGASGIRVTVRVIIDMLQVALGTCKRIEFNNVVREGDPRFYHADISQASSLDWKPSTRLADGIHKYAKWMIGHQGKLID